jgi:Phosphotransferase enzyme family
VPDSLSHTDPEVLRLIAETIRCYVSPTARIIALSSHPMAEEERGWSGAELRRYAVKTDGAGTIGLITKTMGLVERQVGEHLSRQGHGNVPYTHALNLDTNVPALACMQDLGQRKLALPGGTPADIDDRVACALAAIHVANLGQAESMPWLPPADAAYVSDFLLAQVWRSWWDQALTTKPAFAREFARYTPALDAAAVRFLATIQELWREGTSLTLTHGEMHGEHILLHDGRPYFIDWATAHYAPFYLDLVVYFPPHQVEVYRQTLAREGVDIPRDEFMERYREVGRYVGFKWLCSGVWQWKAGPTAVTGRRLLHMIQWALEGTWPERAFLLPDAAWQRLLAQHHGHL